jgi:hypothetical protein
MSKYPLTNLNFKQFGRPYNSVAETYQLLCCRLCQPVPRPRETLQWSLFNI